jgi:hypothetical protein
LILKNPISKDNQVISSLINQFKKKIKLIFVYQVNLQEACKRESPLTNSMEYFLATGNLVSRHGLGILQV